MPCRGSDTTRTRRRRHRGCGRARAPRRWWASCFSRRPDAASISSPAIASCSDTGERRGPRGRPACGGEELVVCRRSAERIEIHCHGGSAAVDQVLDTLAAAGCQTLSAADWMLGRAPDRLIAEARSGVARKPAPCAWPRCCSINTAGRCRAASVQAIQHIAAGRPSAAQQHAAHAAGLVAFRSAADPSLAGGAGRQDERRKEQLAQRAAGLPAIVGRPRGRDDPRRVDGPHGRGRLASRIGRYGRFPRRGQRLGV